MPIESEGDYQSSSAADQSMNQDSFKPSEASSRSMKKEVEPFDGKDQEYLDSSIHEENQKIEMRQVKNIHTMMKESNERTDKHREESPFMNYAMNKYNLPLEDDLEQSSLDNASKRSSFNDKAAAAKEPSVEKLDETIPLPVVKKLKSKPLIQVKVEMPQQKRMTMAMPLV